MVEVIVYFRDEPHIVKKQFDRFESIAVFIDLMKRKGYEISISLNLDKPVMKEK